MSNSGITLNICERCGCYFKKNHILKYNCSIECYNYSNPGKEIKFTKEDSRLIKNNRYSMKRINNEINKLRQEFDQLKKNDEKFEQYFVINFENKNEQKENDFYKRKLYFD